MKGVSQHRSTEMFHIGTVQSGSHQPYVAMEQVKFMTEELNLILLDDNLD